MSHGYEGISGSGDLESADGGHVCSRFYSLSATGESEIHKPPDTG